MARPTRTRRLGTWILAAAGTVGAIILAVVFVSGVGIADQAGQPLDMPAVAVTPGANTYPVPTPTPTPSSDDDEDDSPTVVDAPPPVTVDLDDHGGDSGSSDGSSSGHSNG